MANHDRYEMDILKQLTRIANSLERIEKKTKFPASDLLELADCENKECWDCALGRAEGCILKEAINGKA